MAKVLRTHQITVANLTEKVKEEILLLTRGVACPDCVEILFESDLYRRLLREVGPDGGVLSSHDKDGLPHTVMGFKYRVVYGPGVRYGSLTVITRTEVVFK